MELLDEVSGMPLLLYVAQVVKSVRNARLLITGGKVRLNGQVVADPYHTLAPDEKGSIEARMEIELPKPVEFIQLSYEVSDALGKGT